MNADKIEGSRRTLLVQGGFVAEETHHTQMGAMVSAEGKGRPGVLVWANLGAIAMGSVRRLFGGRKR
jgi:hypothetical protein